MSKKRKYYSPEEKVSILKQHLVNGVPVSELCERHQLQPTVFYRWQRQLFEKSSPIGSEDDEEERGAERVNGRARGVKKSIGEA